MLSFAPRIPRELLDAIVRLDDPTVPIAEVSRRVGREAWRLGLTRPSYQRVRELVHLVRRLRARRRRRATVDLLLDVWFQKRPPVALLDVLIGDVAPLPP